MEIKEVFEIVDTFWRKEHPFVKRDNQDLIKRLQGQCNQPLPQSLIDYLQYLPKEDYLFELEVYVDESIILFGEETINFVKAPFNLIPHTSERLGGWNENCLAIGMQKGEADIPHPIVINLGNLEEGINKLENWDYRRVVKSEKEKTLTWEYKTKISNTLSEFVLGVFAFSHAVNHIGNPHHTFKESDYYANEQALSWKPAFWFYPNIVKWIDREAADNWNKVFGLHYNSEEDLDEYL